MKGGFGVLGASLGDSGPGFAGVPSFAALRTSASRCPSNPSRECRYATMGLVVWSAVTIFGA